MVNSAFLLLFLVGCLRASAAFAQSSCTIGTENDSSCVSTNSNSNTATSNLASDADANADADELYLKAQHYVANTDNNLAKIIFGAPGPHVVDHLVIGRGIAGTNVFSARYYNAEAAPRPSDVPVGYTPATSGKDQDVPVLVVGDSVTGLWDTSTYTFAQPFTALTFPFLPFNAKDFVPQQRLDWNEYVSCIDVHKAILVSQMATRMPVLGALVTNLELADEQCPGKKFTVTVKRCARPSTSSSILDPCIPSDSNSPEDQAILCVNEVDVASGSGVPRDQFKKLHNGDVNYSYPIEGIDEDTYEQLTRADSSGFKKAPALIKFRDFILSPNEATTNVALKDENNRVPNILITGGGGTALAAVRRAMRGIDDITQNVLYQNSGGNLAGRNPMMLTELLNYADLNLTSANVNWVSRDSKTGPSLNGANAVPTGSKYDVFSVYKSGHPEFGSMNFEWSLHKITVPSDATMPKVATFSVYDIISKTNVQPEIELSVEFDQLVECIGEDDTVEMFELWSGGRFGETQILYTDPTFPSVDKDQNSNKMISIPYGFGFADTGHDLRFHGAAATAVSNSERADFRIKSQEFMDNGRVSTQHFYGNMLFMASRLRAYSSGFQNEKITKVNVAMDLQEVILKFLNQAQVNPVASQRFLHFLRSIHNSSRNEIDEVWPNYPSGISHEQLENYFDENPDLSAKVRIQEGVILTEKVAPDLGPLRRPIKRAIRFLPAHKLYRQVLAVVGLCITNALWAFLFAV
jgi:hypothetical protein